MAIMVGVNPRDTDGDSYPDILDVTAMLLEGPRNDLVFVPGSFEFELVPLDESIEQPWRVWIFDARQTALAAGPTLFELAWVYLCIGSPGKWWRSNATHGGQLDGTISGHRWWTCG